MKRANNSLRFNLLSTVAFVAIAGAPVAALAQEGQQEGLFTKLGRIVLGAGEEKVAIDTPQAVTVLDQEDIDRTQATTPAELFDTIPGVQAVGSERAVGLSFNIRGVGLLGSSDESKIIITIDGAPKFYEQYRMGSFFSDPELFKRVEVLRGPASSTLYGAGALGGVIAFTTKDAGDFLSDDDDSALRTRLSYDSNGAGKLASIIYAQRFSEQFEGLLALNYREADEFEDGDGVAVIGSDFTSYSGLLKGTYYFGDDNEQSLRLSLTQWQSSLNDTQYSQTGTISAFGTVDRDTTDQTFVLSYANPASGNPFLDLNVVLSYSDSDVVQTDAKGAPFPSTLFSDTHYAYRTHSLKVENTFEMGGSNWDNFLTIGAQISNQDRVLVAATGPLAFHPQGSERKIGLYAQSEFTFGDRLTVIPGLRVDISTLKPDAIIAGAMQQDFTAISPKIQVMYKINDAFSIFGSLAHTERAPTIDEAYSNNRGALVSPDLKKEKADSIELGFTFERFGLINSEDALSLKTTAFYSDVTDKINTSLLGVGFPNYANAEDEQIWGLELEAAYQSERYFGQVALSFVDGKNSRVGGLTPRSIPAPNLSVTLGGRTPGLGLDYGWTGNFVSSITTHNFSSISGVVATDFAGYSTHDLFLGWKPQQGVLQGSDLRLSVSNVTDKNYSNNLSGDNGRGRTVKLTVTKVF